MCAATNTSSGISSSWKLDSELTFCKKITNCHRFYLESALHSQDHGQHNQKK